MGCGISSASVGDSDSRLTTVFVSSSGRPQIAPNTPLKSIQWQEYVPSHHIHDPSLTSAGTSRVPDEIRSRNFPNDSARTNNAFVNSQQKEQVNGADLTEIFDASFRKNASVKCMGFRGAIADEPDYRWMTYHDLQIHVELLQRKFRHLLNSQLPLDAIPPTSYKSITLLNGGGIHVPRPSGPYLVLYAPNSPYWFAAALAGLAIGMIIVPITCSMNVEHVGFILSLCPPSLILCHNKLLDKLKQAIRLSEAKSGTPKCESTILTIDSFKKYDIRCEISEDTQSELISRYSIFDIFEGGSKDLSSSSLSASSAARPAPPGRIIRGLSPPAFILFSSGTSGEPKGVILSHENLYANIRHGVPSGLSLTNCNNPKNRVFDFRSQSGWLHYSYLPCSHILDLIFCLTCLTYGGTVAFLSNSDLKNLGADLLYLRPNVVIGVPRIWTRWKQMAIQLYEKEQAAGNSNKITPLSCIGLDRCQLALCGGGSIASDVHQYFLEQQLPLVNALGSTEGSGFIATQTLSSNSPRDISVGNCGGPIVPTKIKLGPCIELEYYPAVDRPARGEILLHGPSMFTGYLNEDTDYNKVFSVESTVSSEENSSGCPVLQWFRTGDIGEWTDEGALKYVDRRNDVFKLPCGEYCAVEGVELQLQRCDKVQQIWVFGDSFHNSLVAVVVPKISPPSATAGSNNSGINPKYLDSIVVELRAIEKQYLKVYERFEAFHFELTSIDAEGNGFTVANGLLTTTNKLRRKNLVQRYKHFVNANRS